MAQSSLDEIVGLDPDNLEIVDGLQRVTALVEFVQDRLPVFGGHLASGLTGFRVTTAVTVQVNDLRTRADVLRWYLQINDGGTPHSPEEITRVRGLLAAATTTPGSME